MNMRQMRLTVNKVLGQPWDRPIFAEEKEEIRKWEIRWNVTFLPGHLMAVWDPGHEGVK